MLIETADIRAEGINLVGELRRPEKGSVLPSLCICHGIPSGQPPDPGDGGYPALAETFSRIGFLTLIFNFRGTGPSGGNFDILGWTKDLEAAITYLRRRPDVDQSRLYVMGFSGGAAASAYVAAHDERVSGLVLCACPAEFRGFDGPDRTEFSIEHFRRIGIIRDKDFPPSLEWWRGRFKEVSPINWIDRVSPRPLLILHGESDELIHIDQAWRLYLQAGQPKEIVIVGGAGHRLRTSDQGMGLVKQWLVDRLS